MRLRRIWGHLLALTGISILIVLSLSPSLSAATAEPPVLGRAWYWEDYQQQEVTGPTGTVVVETTNPFCPGLPGGLGDVHENACAVGRMPIEIRAGNYKVQNKFSAIAWDFALIPPGSEIQSFKVTFLEAKAGCYDSQGKPGNDPSQCKNEQTTQFNADDKVLQACFLSEFFGDGEGRPLREAPKYQCSSGDPTARRKEVKSKDPTQTGENADHTWTFDLTDYAQRWVDNPPEMTGIVIRAQEPKGDEPTDSNWRVVLAGPNFPDGVVSNLKYIPGAISGGGGGGGGGLIDAGGGGSTFVPGTSGTSGTPGIPGTPGVPTDGTAVPGSQPTTNPTPGASPVSANELKDEPTTTPAYVWLGLLAGLIGFSMVRSLVVESATGIRPDGVLAQIKALNPAGATAGATSTGPWAVIGSGIATAGGWFRSAGSTIGSKLPFGKKG